MVSLKMDPKEAADMAQPSVEPQDAPLYPYGTRLCLDDETLLKLGFAELPPVGTVFKVQAVATVTSVRSDQRQGEIESGLDLQITDMSLDAGSSDDERARKLYPDQE